ncbi:uncharacterized protein F4812DRAFT_40115 [Daldinia caldariorum]|uniref:uncharacterized protein n=1 Tax=Daldinia caldariorum TaxID=326644 RepID=UPI002007F9F8|nr:uncharacterized protein F4812DRAFT_40115 [Daldinia caldariorum]KAI1473126.1 hypothetical protein F4812DRAFT_40115 [Daldinia caldariorum]
MFLHSGASLHGHEYSNRPAPQPGQRRNPLLRSAFTAPIKRSSSYHPSTSPSLDGPSSPNLPRPRPISEYIPKTPEATVRFDEPQSDSTTARPEAMSEDEGSLISDSDASRVSSSARRNRRRAIRKSTTFLLAHPPPKIRSKQRLIHIRPRLLLQMQQLAANRRPRPVIDVFPSVAVAGPLIVPLLKRFPLIARIKRELGIQDIMLVKSEDYDAHASGLDSDGDDDDLKSRELLAILSPFLTEDKAEIVLADGTVWTATPRFNGAGSCSYEFVTVDSNGNTTTARWVRKQIATKSLPITPTSPGFTPTTPVPDYKFTFSIIDPKSRRHPIMATLTNSSLDILDSYTTVSQSAGYYPPTSPNLSTPASPTSGENASERTTQRVEDWQKNFITISAIWVILRHGWSPNWKPTDFGTVTPLSPTTPVATCTPIRSRSVSVNSETASKPSAPATGSRRKLAGALRMGDQLTPNVLPRRATSTGASFAQKFNIETRDRARSSPRQESKNKRAFSGEWDVGLSNRSQASSLAAVLDLPSSLTPLDLAPQSNSASSASSPLSARQQVISESYATDPLSLKPLEIEFSENSSLRCKSSIRNIVRENYRDDRYDHDRKAKHQKWKNMSNWFRKLHGR